MERTTMTLENVSRRTTLQAGLTLATLPLVTAPAGAEAPRNRGNPNLALTTHRKVTFSNRFGITIAAALYQPKASGVGKPPALVTHGRAH
jgi:uncharacterized protein